jgi:hypothetical protein
MTTHQLPARRAGRTVGVIAVVAVMTLMLAPASALAQEASARGIAGACVPEAQQADQFADVRQGQTHQGAIDCLWVYGVVQGHFVDGENVYLPDQDVTRQQMASYVARMLMQLLDRDYELPDVGAEARFDDSGQIASPHIRNVNLLHEVGVARGFEDGTYGPTLSITRAQMASFIARAIEEVSGEQLPRARVFRDVSGVHRANIEKLAAIGVVEGRRSGIFAPDRPTSRAQMASFIARTMDYLVEQGVLNPEDGQGSAPPPPGTVRWEMDEPAGATRMRPVGGQGPVGEIGSRVRPGTQVGGAIAYRFPTVSHEPPARPGQLVTVPHNQRFNPGSGNFRVTLRMRTTSDHFNVVQKGQARTSGGMWKFEMENGRMKCLFRGGDRSTRTATSRTTVVNDGRWHVVSCLRTPNSVTMWVDGVRTERRDGSTGTISNDWELSIGGKSRCNQTSVDCDYFEGDIDWIEITKGR